MFNSMSLDAIVPGWCVCVCCLFFNPHPCPGLPHSTDNIQWVCLRVNLGKNKFNNAEFAEWAKAAFTWYGRPSSLQDVAHSREDTGDEEDEDEEDEDEEDEEEDGEEEEEEKEEEEEWEEWEEWM